MGREITMGKCTDCMAAFYWKRNNNGPRLLRHARCPFCRKGLQQTSSQLKSCEWFNLDEIPVFARASGNRLYGSHHYFTVDVDGQRHLLRQGFNDPDFYALVEELGGYLPRGVYAHHSGTANPRSLAQYPVLYEEVREAFSTWEAPHGWRFKDHELSEDGWVQRWIYDRPVTDVKKYLKALLEKEVA